MKRIILMLCSLIATATVFSPVHADASYTDVLSFIKERAQSLLVEEHSNSKDKPELYETWVCSNGHAGNTGNYCAECGEAKPWTCENGHTGNTGKFCSECGAPKPVVEDSSWTCENGHSGNTGKFCSECGAPKPVAEDGPWTCENGHTGNTGKYCSECGSAKPGAN